MFYIFGDVQSLLKFDVIRIDNMVFALHYKASMVLLIMFSLLVSKKQYFGDPIDCIVDALDSDTIDMFCWIHATYTLPDLTGAKVGEEVAHPGVALIPSTHQHDRNVKHHKYYQWVVLFMLIQAGMFYIPRYMWKRWEAGRVRGLVGELHLALGDKDVRRTRVSAAVEYFGLYFHNHNLYAYQFFVCEILNFVNVVGQIYFTDTFLGLDFLDYGPRMLNYARDPVTPAGEPMYDPADEIFPKVAKCAFHKFGPSGSLIRHDALCVLPLNILNEKIYTFLWFWFVLVSLVTGLWLVCRVVVLAVPAVRQRMLRHRSRLVVGEKVDRISTRCKVGDWFILYLLAQNMDPFVYKEFIDGLTVKLVEKEHLS